MVLEKMVFGEYQDGYNGSHIKCPNGTGLAFMNLNVVFTQHVQASGKKRETLRFLLTLIEASVHIWQYVLL